MSPRTYSHCIHCNATEIEPYTPAAFDAMQDCIVCEQPCCQNCGDSDLNESGNHTVITCILCTTAEEGEQDGHHPMPELQRPDRSSSS